MSDSEQGVSTLSSGYLADDESTRLELMAARRGNGGYNTLDMYRSLHFRTTNILRTASSVERHYQLDLRWPSV